MTVSHAPAQPRKQKRKPDPSRIYESYVYAVSTIGKRRAARHVAEQYGLSDDTIRRLIAKIERVDDTPAELTYIAPDPLYDSRRMALSALLVEAARPAQQRRLENTRQPQNDLVPPAYVEPEPQALPQPDGPAQRHIVMSNTPNFELEMRQIGIEFTSQKPQIGMPQTRTTEREQQPQDSIIKPQVSDQVVTSTGDTVASKDLTSQEAPGAMEATPPTRLHPTPISMHADYIQQRTAPRQRPIPVLNIHTIAAQLLQPGPVLAMVIFVILVGLIYMRLLK
jgi:hypothetical protein